MSNEAGSFESWERMAAELRAGRAAQRQAWGDTDNLLLGRYLADDLSPEERQQVEQALEEHPDLQLLTEVVREVMAEPEPAILPFRTRRVTGLTRHRALLAAACALLIVGLPAVGYLAIPPLSEPPMRPVALHFNKTEDRRDAHPLPPGPPPVPDPPPAPTPLDATPAMAEGNLGGVASYAGPEVPQQREAELLLEQGKRDLEFKQYDRAQDAFRKAQTLLSHPTQDARLRKELSEYQEKAEVLARSSNSGTVRAGSPTEPTHVAAKVQPFAAEATPDHETLSKATAALQAFSPAAGHIADALRIWSERWKAKQKK